MRVEIQKMFFKTSTPVQSRFSAVRKHNIPSTAKNVVNRSRSPSPPPIFRHQVENSIRIITDVQPPQKSSSQSPAAVPQNQNDGSHYQKVFATKFIQHEVKVHSRLEKSFTLPESWLLESLTDYHPEEYHGNTTNGKQRCTCCLCKVRHRCGDTKICIENHRYDKTCANIGVEPQPKPKNTILKYQKQHVCDPCMSSLTTNTKKTKQKYFRCYFPACSIQVKSIKSLRKHYLDHLKVKEFVCNLCEKGFKSRSGMKMHERTHL